MAYPPLPQSLLQAVERFDQPRAQLYQTHQGWQSISARELLRRIAGLSRALTELGLVPGDRLGLFAPNCPEWHIADFATLGIGAADVPVYFRESTERMVYILNHSGARVVFVAGTEQAERLMSARGQLRSVEHVIMASGGADYGSEVLDYQTLVGTAGQAEISLYRQRVAQLTTEMLATIIYTSGTTGEPKGVMLTENNLASNAADALQLADYGRADTALSFLPLAHVYERTLDYIFLFRGVSIAYLEAPERLAHALLEVRPTLAGAVPRVFEKLYATVVAEGRQEKGLRRAIFEWAMRVAPQFTEWRAYGKDPGFWRKRQWQIADRLVYSKIRAGLGGHMREMVSGGAPLSADLARFFWAVGLPVFQGYGLTETSPVVSVNTRERNRLGSVGPAIPNVEVRIAADGEILARGPLVMRGYYQKPEETAAAISADGWLATGDIGKLDADGFLYVTDRKKDLFKTSAGKYIAPQAIENALKSSAYISNAAVIGDRRKFIVALIVPDFAAVQAAAAEQGLRFDSPAELAASPWVQALIGREIANLDTHLAQFETIKRFAVLDSEFSFEKGELTYTMKLKRRVIEQRYHKLIESLYADVEEPKPKAVATD
jgi:long-chain acyl-CoA synthetase